MREDERRARIMAAVAGPDITAGAGELARRLCRFAVEEMALSGCAVVLMSVPGEGCTVVPESGSRSSIGDHDRWA